MSAESPVMDAIDAFNRGELTRARALAEEALAFDASGKAHHLLGLIDCRAGSFESGIDWLRKACEAAPDNAGFRVILARALVDSGRVDDALDVASPPRGTSPPEIALWQVRGEAALLAGDHLKSAQAWRAVCLARPGDWRAWANCGHSLAELEKWSEAAVAYRRATALNPEEQPLRDNFAAALVHAGRYEEAADELQRLLDRGPEDLTARLTLARVLAELGRADDSAGQLVKAASHSGASTEGDTGLIKIALGPEDDPASEVSEEQVTGVSELALLLERTNRMDALRNLIADAEQRGVPKEAVAFAAAALSLRDGDAAEAKRLLELADFGADAVLRHRLMAKIADSLGDPAAAFAAAEAMNQSVRDRESWLQGGARLRRQLRGSLSRMTPDWAARLRPLQPDERRSPAFLVGFPRSGTTLLDTFLRGHPRVQVMEELGMLRAAEAALDRSVELPNRSRSELRRGRDAYFAELHRHLDPAFHGVVVDKLPLNMVGLPLIHMLFPDARIIFAQRHPCDCVLSGFMQGFKMNEAMASFLTLEGAADLYDVAMSTFTRSRELLRANVHTIVYEELLDDPEAVLRPLIRHLELDWVPGILDHRTTAKERVAINTPSYDQVVQPLTKAPSGRWKRYREQLEPVLPILLPWAERLGYGD